jgi:hypothetical protein
MRPNTFALVVIGPTLAERVAASATRMVPHLGMFMF